MTGHGSQGAQEQRADLQPCPCMSLSSAGVKGMSHQWALSVSSDAFIPPFLPRFRGSQAAAGFVSQGPPEAGRLLVSHAEQGSVSQASAALQGPQWKGWLTPF